MKLQTGFNLIEVLIVLAIIGIIAGVGWPMFLEQGRTSNRTDAITATNTVAIALTQFQSDTGSFSWSTPPTANPVNAHSRYLPLVPVGVVSGTVADNICSQQRGFRWVPANARYESCRGLYSIVVDIGGPTVADALGSGDGTDVAYIITATAIVGRPQANDLECNSFTLDSNGVKGHIAINNSVAITGNPPKPDDPVTMQPGATTDGPYHSTKRCWASD